MKNSNNCLDPERVERVKPEPVERVDIVRIRQGKREELKDSIAREVPLTINLNKKELVTLLCTPKDIEDLVKGFLFTSGLIRERGGLKDIVLDEPKWTVWANTKKPLLESSLIFKRLYTSGCGKGTIFYNMVDILHRHKIESRFKISSQSILSLMQEFQRRSTLFMKTGAVHSAALSNGRDILIFREDIGRHSAVDKIIGRALVEGIDMRDKIILSSGRISSEILLKAQKCVIPIVISRGAPTNQAVKLARDLNITVVGFARGDRLNVYSANERVR